MPIKATAKPRKKRVATEPSITSGQTSVAAANNETLPSVPLARANPRETLGDSGTRMLHGIITEEYNPNLQGVAGIRVYDEMRKSDGTVRAAILAVTLPVRRAEWFINPASEDQKDKDIATFVQHALFDWLDLPWDDIIRQALLMIPFGVMPFEKVYTVKEFEGTQYVTLAKLAPRLPKSILQWELPDRTFGIQQIRQDGVLALIPGSKLLIFCNEREGNNWWGTSMLRSAYSHWYRKNVFYKIDAIAFERQGLGVPYIKMPPGYTNSDESKAEKVLQNLRANEAAYLVLPSTYEAGFMDMGARTTRDPSNAIEHHNKEILQSVLAQFLELGATSSGSGSHALSSDHSDLFLKAVETIANTIIAEINKNLIPELVDLNFTDIESYPKLDYAGIQKADVAALGTTYGQLVTAGGISPTIDDEQYLRAALGLPPRTPEQIEESEEAKKSNKTIGDIITSPDETEPDTTTAAVDNVDTVDKSTEKVKETPTDAKDVKKKDKQIASEFKPWRKLTFAEEKVNFPKIQDTMDAMEAAFASDASDLLNKSKDAFVAKLYQALKSGDMSAVADLELGFVSSYKSLLKDAMKNAYEYGKNNASTEMGLSPQASSAEAAAQRELLATAIVNKTMQDLESKAKLAIAHSVGTDATELQTVGLIDKALTDSISQIVDSTAGYTIGQNINSGRNDVFVRNENMIYALQRSEILDRVTCDFCAQMDRLVISTNDPSASDDTYHSNCRGIWVEILKDEENPPEVTGIPKDLDELYGGQPNALKQPSKDYVAKIKDGMDKNQ